MSARCRSLLVALALALSLVVPAGVMAARPAPSGADDATPRGGLDATDRYIVLTRSGRDPEAVARGHRDRGVRSDQTFDKAARGFSARLNPAQKRELAADPDVTAIVPDEIIAIQAQTTPTGVSRIGTKVSPVAKIDGVDTRVNADVAIVDTGIDPTHPDLNVVGGYNCSTSNRSAWQDANGHGTHVAGTVGAIDNGSGVVGVAPGVRLWAVRILNADGFGYLSWYVCGLDWIAAQRDPSNSSRPLFESVNMSVAKDGRDDNKCGTSNADILHQAICRLVASGVTVVAAAANDSANASTRVPAAYDEVITVSALADTDGKSGGLGGNRCWSWGTYDVDDTFADFSNYGADVDLIAPGKCIWSTLPGNRYGYSSGTSMAAPHVAGAVALYKASRPEATPLEVKEALQYLGSTNWNVATDPDSFHERLLNVSKIAPLGDFSIGDRPAIVLNEEGGTISLPIDLTRTGGFFEPVGLTATAPSAIGVTISGPSLGFGTPSATATIVVPPATPAGTYDVTIRGAYHSVSRASTTQIVVENDPPTASPPTATIVTGARTGAASVPVRFSWAEATDPSSAIAGYQFAIQVDGGAWSSPIGLAAGTRSYTRSLAIGALYAARVRARDRAGNWSPWAVSPTGSIGQISENSRAVAYRGTWNRYSVTSAIGGGTRYATARGASARVTVTRRVAAIIAPKGPTRGSAAVYVNGVYRATISLYAKTSTARNVVYVASFATSATRTVELRVLGTAGHPRVDIDGVVVLR